MQSRCEYIGINITKNGNNSASSKYQTIFATSTLLPTSKDLVNTYPSNAPEIFYELIVSYRSQKLGVLFRVNTIYLIEPIPFENNCYEVQSFWYLCDIDIRRRWFNNDNSDDNEVYHTKRHHMLLCHYLNSTKELLLLRKNKYNFKLK